MRSWIGFRGLNKEMGRGGMLVLISTFYVILLSQEGDEMLMRCAGA